MKELRVEIGVYAVNDRIENNTLRWLQDINRMDNNRYSKQVMDATVHLEEDILAGPGEQ